MEYKIISRISRDCTVWPGEMEEEVARAITEGWKPLGGISMTEAGEYYTIVQTMVKE